MATLVNWFDDPLRKRTGVRNQTKFSNQSLRQNNRIFAGNQSSVTQSQPKATNNSQNTATQSQPKIVNSQNVAKSFQPSSTSKVVLKANRTPSLESLSTIQKVSTPQQSSIQTKLSTPKFNTLDNNNNRALTTLSTLAIGNNSSKKTAQPKLTQSKESDSWFNQVEDSDKLRQYYDEEFKKNNDKAGFFGRMFDGGQVAATAKTEALNRYNQDLLRRAYDDNGKVVDTKAYAELNGKTADLATQAAEQSHQIAQAQTNRIGANDLDQDFGKRFLHTMEAINGMDMASGFVGVNDPEKFGLDDIGRFALNLPAGIVTSPITGARNAGRAISGRGLNAETGEIVGLSGLQRLGAGLSAGIDLVSPFIGGSGSLVKSLATSGAKQAAKQAGKQAAKSGAKEFVKHLAKEAVEEAGEEALQNLAEELNEQGGWDEGTLGRTAEAAAMGALGSGLKTGAGTAISAGKTKLNQQGGLRGLIGEAKNTVDSRARNVGDAIGGIMASNNQRLAYAGGGELVKQDITNNKNNSIRTDMTIVKGAAPDGGDLVISDSPIDRGINQNKAAKVGRENLKKLVGNIVSMGDGKVDTIFNKKYRGELARRNNDMSGNQYRAKLDLLGNADELFDTARNVKSEPNRKPLSKPDVEGYYTGTSYGQDGTGKIYEMSVKSQVKKDGSNNPYVITNLNETPGRGYLKSGDQTQNAQASLSDTRIAQNIDNVNTKNTLDMGQHTESISSSNISQNPTDVNTKSELDTLYKQYGSDFYDKLPDNLRTQYDTMLDNAPRDKNGVYTDPITGEKWIDEVIRGGAPDGSNLVRTERNLPHGASTDAIGQAIRDVISERFQGRKYRIGETDSDAKITAKTRHEMSFKQGNMSNADFAKKGSMAGNLDELIENMSDVREVPNHKPEQKPNVDHYLSGRVAVDLGDGKVYYPRVDIEVSKNGNAIGYNIADIREFPQSRPQGSLSSATNSLVDNEGTHSRTPNIAQDSANVNKNLSSLVVDEGGEVTDRRTLSQETLRTQLGEREELKAYYKKYGDDFYEKLSEDLRDRYEEMLESIPRSKDGTYTDPITGEKWIDENAGHVYNETEATQRLNDLIDGKISYDDYSKFQSERLWEGFRDSNGGVETFLKGLNDYDSEGNRADVSRHTISNNGALYRQLYDEYGRKPSKKLFNEALEDVLTNGENSKYYNAFKEFDPEIGLYNAGSDDIDTLIATREYVNTSEYKDMMSRTAVERQRDLQTPKGEVKSIDQLLDPAIGNSKGNKFVTLLRGVNDRAKKVIKDAIGIDVNGYNHVMSESAVRHALNRHGGAGELSVTMSDIKKARDVIAKADTIEYIGKNKLGLDVIRYTKQYDNRVVYLEEVRNGRRQLAMDTMYKQEVPKQKTASPTNPQQQTATDSRRASSRSERLVDNSIAQDNNNVNKSKFSTDTVLRSEELGDDFRAQLRSNRNNNSKTYKAFTDQSALENTVQFLQGKTLVEAESDIVNRLNKKLGTADKQDISDALAVVKQLERKGDTASFERAEQIIDKVSQHATKAGQNIQALSLLSHKTPEGLLYGATKELKKNNIEVTTEIRQKLQENIKSIANERRRVDVAQKAMENASRKIDQAIKEGTITDFTDLIKAMKETGKRYRDADDQLSYSYARLSKTVADKIPQSAGSIYSTLIKGGMLSAPTTHGKNITSNATFMVMRKASELVGAGVDQLASVFTGRRSTTFTLRGEGEGAVRGTKYAINTLKTGLEEGADSSKYGSGVAELKFKNKVADTVLGKPNRAVFRLMSAGDKAFRYAGQTNSLYKQALAAGKNQNLKGQALEAFVTRFVNNPDMKSLSKAMNAGEKVVLGQQNKAANAISNFVQTLKKSDSAGVRGIGSFVDAHIIPFVKVPTNFLTEAVSYTPLQLGAEMSHQIDCIRTGRGFDQESFSNSLGKVAVGSGVIAALATGVQIADSVEISGDYPDDDAAEQARWQAEGIQENSIRIGDRWYRLEALGPFALFAGAGVNFKKSLDRGMGTLDATATALANFTSALADQSFLTGINEVTELLNGGMNVGTAGTSWVRSQVSTLIPNIIKKAASATDQYQRAYDSHAGLGTNVAQAIAGGIPGARQAVLDKKVDVYGNELKNQSFISGFLDPTGSSKALQRDNEVIQEVARLKQVAEENATKLDEDSLKLLSATPNKTKINLSSGGENYTLTDKQARELQTLTGQKISRVYRETMSSEKYQNASDLDKAAMLKQARTAATTLAKNEFAGQNNFSQSKLTGDAKKLKNDNFTANATAEGTNSEGSRSIEISDSLGDGYKKILDQYNSMEKEDWERYIYSTEGREAEYRLAEAKLENDKANGELTEVEELKRKKELRKLKVSQTWDKSVRDAYSLAGSKTDMQELLNGLDNRDDMVGYLNALNRAMYDAGVITASTYKSRNRNINNLESSSKSTSKSSNKSAYSTASKTALSAYMKALANGNDIKVNKSTSAPSTNRRMSAVAIATGIKNSNLGAKARVSVKKGIV